MIVELIDKLNIFSIDKDYYVVADIIDGFDTICVIAEEDTEYVEIIVGYFDIQGFVPVSYYTGEYISEDELYIF